MPLKQATSSRRPLGAVIISGSSDAAPLQHGLEGNLDPSDIKPNCVVFA